MNRFGTLLAWANGFVSHTALPAIAAFIASIIHDELPVAEAMVQKIIGSIPASLAADKPLVALGAVLAAAADQAIKDGVTIGRNSLVVAASNAVDTLAGTVPVTQVDAADAMAQVDNEAAAQIKAIQDAADARKKVLSDAAAEASAALAAKVSN
jgi:hypothetical protein